jgi:hypothetical protein
MEEQHMSSKKQKAGNHSSTFAKPRIVPVAEGSLQSKTPGGGPGPRANEQNSLNRGSRQAANMASQGGQYGGIATQQPRFSARQQAQRMQARAEESRRGESQQSGWGGMEQDQHGGAQQSQTASSRSGAGPSSAHERSAADVDLPPSDFGSKHKPGGGGTSR